MKKIMKIDCRINIFFDLFISEKETRIMRVEHRTDNLLNKRHTAYEFVPTTREVHCIFENGRT